MEKDTKILIKDYLPVMPVDWVERHLQVKWAKRRMEGEQKQWQVRQSRVGKVSFPARKVGLLP